MYPSSRPYMYRSSGPKGCPASSQHASETIPPPMRWITSPSKEHLAGTASGLSVEHPLTSLWSVSPTKRLFDISVSLLALLVLALPMLAIAILIRLSSRGSAIFVQKRMGRAGRLFSLYKFRSMESAPADPGPGLTREGDHRVTPLGRILRKLKLDELPQFYNILRGDMSLIGPRPKLPQYVSIRNMPFRPGLTGAATLAFCREEEMLRHIHPALLDDFYNRHIRPKKARIDLHYMARATFLSDLQILAATFFSCAISQVGKDAILADRSLEEI